MKKRRESLRRLAQRVLSGVEILSVSQRIEIFEDVALILPPDEAKVARNAAIQLREAVRQQETFLHLLNLQ